MIESLAYQRRAGLPVEHAMPLVFKAISVNVERLLDLLNSDVLASLGTTLDQLRTDKWWLSRALGEESLTQAVGRAAHACGVQAILAPSAHTASHGHNLIVLPDHLQPPNRVTVLRRPAKTWRQALDRHYNTHICVYKCLTYCATLRRLL